MMRKKYKISNDSKIFLFKSKMGHPIKGSFQEAFTEGIAKMEIKLLEFKTKRKFNQSLTIEKKLGLFLSKNVDLFDVNNERKQWYDSFDCYLD